MLLKVRVPVAMLVRAFVCSEFMSPYVSLTVTEPTALSTITVARSFLTRQVEE
jgi:hypothetical protein